MNKRLEEIKNCIKEGRIVADIGTDHAFLPISLRKEDIVPKVYACDINAGPLEVAKRNIEEAGVDHIETILCDGFTKVPEDCDCIVLAGMGYYTAIHILEEDIDRLSSFKEIIVEVNTDEELMRKWISDHHYSILDERIVCENKHYYVIIVFNTDESDELRPIEIQCGPILMNHPSDTFIDYCDYHIEKLNEIIEKVPLKEKEEMRKRINNYIEAKK